MLFEVRCGAGAPISSGGSSAGGPDISALLRPALAKGSLRCMAASTIQEYRKRIEGDAALARCFQPVEVREPLAPEATMVRTPDTVLHCQSVHEE